MGCTTSTPDPNQMYGSEHKNIVPYSKKNDHNQSSNNNVDLQNGKVRDRKAQALKGDRSWYTDAKVKREKKLRDTLLNREILAKEMSDRVMEEKERLSLTSSRSRATSPRGSFRAGARSIGDVGVTSASVSSFADLPQTDSANNSHTELPDATATAATHTVRWKDQNGSVNKHSLSPHDARTLPVGAVLRNISSISERSENTEAKI